jgi:phosphoserine phosphatase RsbX
MTESIGAAQRSAPGETVCGDAYAILAHGSTTLIALADGLGHGSEAAEAALRFIEFARANAERGLEDILRGAHRALAGTRGAAAGLLRFDPSARAIEFAGVGNIEVLARSRHRVAPICMPGVLGGRLKRTVRFGYAIDPGDLVVLCSDGLTRVELGGVDGARPQKLAEQLLKTHYGGRDDATCVVLRA